MPISRDLDDRQKLEMLRVRTMVEGKREITFQTDEIVVGHKVLYIWRTEKSSIYIPPVMGDIRLKMQAVKKVEND